MSMEKRKTRSGTPLEQEKKEPKEKSKVWNQKKLDMVQEENRFIGKHTPFGTMQGHEFKPGISMPDQNKVPVYAHKSQQPQKKKPVSAKNTSTTLGFADQTHSDEGVDNSLSLRVESAATGTAIKDQASQQHAFGRPQSSIDRSQTMVAKKFSPEVVLDSSQEQLKAIMLKLMDSPEIQSVIQRSSQGPITVSDDTSPQQMSNASLDKSKPYKRRCFERPMQDKQSLIDEMEEEQTVQPSEEEKKEAADRKVKHASKLTPNQMKAFHSQSVQQLIDSLKIDGMIVRWEDICNNILRKTREKGIPNDEKQELKDLRKALLQADPNVATPGFRGFKQYARYAFYPTKTCKKCDALVLTCTRDKHSNTQCEKRGIDAVAILGNNKHHFCVRCFQRFENVHDCRLHMSQQWPPEQFKALGYRYLLFKNLQPLNRGMPLSSALGEEARQMIERPSTKDEEDRQQFFDLLVGETDAMLASFRDNCEQFTMNVPPAVGSMVVYDGYLCSVFDISILSRGYLQQTVGDHIAKALNQTHNICRQNDYFREDDVQALLYCREAIVFKHNKFFGQNPSAYTLKRYFDSFKDTRHRADLAFAMVQLASEGNEKRILLQRLQDPDLWYYAATEQGISIHFAGMAYSIRFEGHGAFDEREIEIRMDDIQDVDYNLPVTERRNNYVACIIYAIKLVCGCFNNYREDYNGYNYHDVEVVTVRDLEREHGRKPYFEAVGEALNLLRYGEGYNNLTVDTTVGIIEKLFQAAGFSHKDPSSPQEEKSAIGMYRYDLYGYLEGDSMHARKAAIQSCYAKGRLYTFKILNQTLFPRPQ